MAKKTRPDVREFYNHRGDVKLARTRPGETYMSAPNPYLAPKLTPRQAAMVAEAFSSADPEHALRTLGRVKYERAKEAGDKEGMRAAAWQTGFNGFLEEARNFAVGAKTTGGRSSVQTGRYVPRDGYLDLTGRRYDFVPDATYHTLNLTPPKDVMRAVGAGVAAGLGVAGGAGAVPVAVGAMLPAGHGRVMYRRGNTADLARLAKDGYLSGPSIADSPARIESGTELGEGTIPMGGYGDVSGAPINLFFNRRGFNFDFGRGGRDLQGIFDIFSPGGGRLAGKLLPEAFKAGAKTREEAYAHAFHAWQRDSLSKPSKAGPNARLTVSEFPTVAGRDLFRLQPNLIFTDPAEYSRATQAIRTRDGIDTAFPGVVVAGRANDNPYPMFYYPEAGMSPQRVLDPKVLDTFKMQEVKPFRDVPAGEVAFGEIVRPNLTAWNERRAEVLRTVYRGMVGRGLEDAAAAGVKARVVNAPRDSVFIDRGNGSVTVGRDWYDNVRPLWGDDVFRMPAETTRAVRDVLGPDLPDTLPVEGGKAAVPVEWSPDDLPEFHMAAKGGEDRFAMSRNFLATDKVPETIFGIPIVSDSDDYTPEDIAFFHSHPEAGGYYDLGEGTPEDGSGEGAPAQASKAGTPFRKGPLHYGPPPPPSRGPYPGIANNPGNVEKHERRMNKTLFPGEIGGGVRPKRFAVFGSPVDGLNAAAVVLSRRAAELKKAGKPFTIENYAPRYAPPAENDTEAYIQNLSKYSGIARDAAIDLSNAADMKNLLKTVVRFESGEPHSAWFTDEEYDRAVRQMEFK